jgi:hypothetical protein
MRGPTDFAALACEDMPVATTLWTRELSEETMAEIRPIRELDQVSHAKIE